MRTLLLLLLAVLTVGCASAPPVPPGTPVLEVESLEERALLLLLADRETWEPISLSTALEAGPDVRRLGALAIARIGDARGTSLLVSLLGDPDATVRRTAAFALGLLPLGDGSGAAALLGALQDPDRETARLAVEALARLGVDLETVVEHLIGGAASEMFPRLVPSLFRFQSRTNPSAAVVRWATEGLREGGDLRTMAAYALARTPVPDAAPALRGLLDDADPRVRAWAARGLGEVGGRDDLERLRPLLNDAQPGPIIQALRSARRLIDAGHAAPPMDWQPRLLDLMRDPRPGVRLTAIEASTAWLLDSDLEARLLDLTLEGLPRERELALLALAEGASPAADGATLRAARDEDASLRRTAARAAGLVADIALLAELERDKDPAVRAAALDTWLAAGDTPENVDRAAEALLDRDAGVRATALEWLADHPAVDLEILVATERLARGDRIQDARLAAVRALGKRAEAEELERGAAIAVLEELAGGRDRQVHAAAAAALAALGKEVPPAGAGERRRPVDVYRDVVQRTLKPRRVEIATDHGALTVELACPQAPLTCLNFLQLAGQGFYDGLPFHRVVPDFVVQAGDPRGDGRGGPGYKIRDEPNLLRYQRGTVGMALSGPDTGGSQFFITLAPQPHLDGGYTAFGTVVGGDEVLDEIVQGDRILAIHEVPTP